MDEKRSRQNVEGAAGADIRPDDPARRAALRALGGYALSVAPGMIVLTSGTASAQSRRQSGAGTSDTSSNGGPQASCDNPAWDLGLNRAGHSGC